MMRRLQPLFLAPALLLLGAAPYTEKSWYSIAAEDGTPIGFGYSEYIGPLNAATTTQYEELTLKRPGQPDTRLVDRITSTLDADSRPREIVERIQNGSETTDIHMTVAGGVATITRVVNGETQTKRIAVPKRLFTYNMFAPSRCMPRTDVGPFDPFFEFHGPTMTLDRVVDKEMGGFDTADNGVRWMPRRRYDGDKLRTTERIGYDGDCVIVKAFKSVFGVTVRIMLAADREAALQGKPLRR